MLISDNLKDWDNPKHLTNESVLLVLWVKTFKKHESLKCWIAHRIFSHFFLFIGKLIVGLYTEFVHNFDWLSACVAFHLKQIDVFPNTSETQKPVYNGWLSFLVDLILLFKKRYFGFLKPLRKSCFILKVKT